MQSRSPCMSPTPDNCVLFWTEESSNSDRGTALRSPRDVDCKLYPLCGQHSVWARAKCWSSSGFNFHHFSIMTAQHSTLGSVCTGHSHSSPRVWRHWTGDRRCMFHFIFIQCQMCGEISSPHDAPHIARLLMSCTNKGTRQKKKCVTNSVFSATLPGKLFLSVELKSK